MWWTVRRNSAGAKIRTTCLGVGRSDSQQTLRAAATEANCVFPSKRGRRGKRSVLFIKGCGVVGEKKESLRWQRDGLKETSPEKSPN